MGHSTGQSSTDEGLFPHRSHDDALRLTKTMEARMVGLVERHPEGCVTVPRSARIRLVSGKRIQLRKYLYMRCVSDTLEGYTRVTCPARTDGRVCVAPEHFVAIMCNKKDPAETRDAGGPFGDLPDVRNRKVVVLAPESTPEAPVVRDCFRMLSSRRDMVQLWNIHAGAHKLTDLGELPNGTRT